MNLLNTFAALLSSHSLLYLKMNICTVGFIHIEKRNQEPAPTLRTSLWICISECEASIRWFYMWMKTALPWRSALWNYLLSPLCAAPSAFRRVQAQNTELWAVAGFKSCVFFFLGLCLFSQVAAGSVDSHALVLNAAEWCLHRVFFFFIMSLLENRKEYWW